MKKIKGDFIDGKSTIAGVREPLTLSLSDMPNYIEFAGFTNKVEEDIESEEEEENEENKQPAEFDKTFFQLRRYRLPEGNKPQSLDPITFLIIHRQTGTKYLIRGNRGFDQYEGLEEENTGFFRIYLNDSVDTLNSLIACYETIPFLGNNYNMSIDYLNLSARLVLEQQLAYPDEWIFQLVETVNIDVIMAETLDLGTVTFKNIIHTRYPFKSDTLKIWDWTIDNGSRKNGSQLIIYDAIQNKSYVFTATTNSNPNLKEGYFTISDNSKTTRDSIVRALEANANINEKFAIVYSNQDGIISLSFIPKDDYKKLDLKLIEDANGLIVSEENPYDNETNGVIRPFWDIEVVSNGFRIENGKEENISGFFITNNHTQEKHGFEGTKKPNEVGLTTDGVYKFFVGEDDSYPFLDIASNMIAAFKSNDFINEHYLVRLSNGINPIIRFVLKNQNRDYAFELQPYPKNEEYFDEFIYWQSTNPFVTRNGILLSVLGYEKSEDKEVIKLNSTFNLVDETSNTSFTFSGTKESTLVDKNTFYIHEDPLVIAENIKNCLIQHPIIKQNYEVLMVIVNGKMKPQIRLTPSNEKLVIPIRVSQSSQFKSIIKAEGKIRRQFEDSISKNSDLSAVILEVYTNTASFLGENKYPEDSLGTYMTTLSKSYHGQPLWFNINTLMQNKATYSDSIIKTTHKGEMGIWQDAGTATDFRFVAKRFDGANHEPFYLSEVLYNITGYKRNLEENDLTDYIYHYSDNTPIDFKLIKPLSNQPKLTHIEGQTQFFNFILSDKNRNIASSKQLGLVYSLYSQSNRFLADITLTDSQLKNEFKVVNTIALDIDQAIEKYTNEAENAKQVGWVKVALAKEEEKISETIDFQILPSCLYKVKDYAFLNSLGGWNSFNFGGNNKTSFKANTNTIFKTQTPDFKIGSQIESVFNKEISEEFTAETSPINEQTVNWLKEMSASQAVYELSTGRYIVVSNMKIEPNSKDELFRVEMKYRYSDSYNATI